MRISHTIPDSDIELACDCMEEVFEGVIESMRREIEQDPDAFPCCTHCGEFCQFPSPGFPAPGYTPILIDGRTLHVRNVAEIVRGGGGNSVDLACFQAAQRRRRGSDPYCSVVVNHDGHGNFTALVRNSDKHKEEARRNIIEPAVSPDDAQACGCGGHSSADAP